MDAVTLEAVFTAVNTIYEAALDQERWGDVVALVRDLFGGSRACILRFGPEGPDAVQSVFDPELNSIAVMEAIVRDPLVQAHLAMPVGAVWQRPMVVDEAAFRKRELWQDWFRPRDMHGQLVCKLGTSSTANWFIDINRGPRQGMFAEVDLDVMKKIAPHLLRAGQIGRQIAGAKTAAALQDTPFGLLLVDGNRRVARMNEAAEALLARPDSPLALKHGTVDAADPAVAQRFSSLVADACSLHGGVMPGIGGVVRVLSRPDASGGAGYVLSIAPYREAPFYSLATECYAAIMVTAITPQVGEGFEAHVMAVFGLSEAEARLAADLASGLSVTESAARRNISVKSARTYLARIFRKTGTHHQSELVATLKTVQPLVAP